MTAIEKVHKKTHLTSDPTAPELHSKRVITVFSVLFSTIFGAALLMYNMKQTKNRKGSIQVLVFGILYTLGCIAVINLIDTSANLAILFNVLGAVVLKEYFWNKFIGKDFEYRKRSWTRPAVVSAIIILPFILALFFVLARDIG